jgi:4-oxalomesaconate tautomerase
MNLGDVREKTVPKMTLVSAARERRGDRHPQFHPAPLPSLHRGAWGGQRGDGLPAARHPAFALADRGSGAERALAIEHPSGAMTVVARLSPDGDVAGAAILRTARKLMDGVAFSR